MSSAVTVYATGLVKLFAVVPLVCATPPTVMLAPVVANVATSAVTFVPNGTVALIVVPLIVATTLAPRFGLLSERNAYDVIAFAVLGAMVTATVYVCIERFAAVTVYVTG